MSEQKDKKPDSSCSKALLYSEMLTTSVAGHVQQLLQKKKKSFTYYVPRSSVLARASKFLQSIDEAGEDVKNIEEIEEGEAVIDMSVIWVKNCEDESDIDTENEDLENGAEDKIILCSDSENEQSDNERFNSFFKDESMHKVCDSDSELSEVKRYKCELPEIDKYKGENIYASSSDTDDESVSSDIDDEQSESSDFGNEQAENDSKEVLLEGKRLNILPKSRDEISEKESELKIEENNYLEPSNSDFTHLISDLLVPKRYPPFYHKNKRNLISVIEDDDENLSLCKKQKRV